MLSVDPRDRGDPVIEIELRESVAVAQRFQFLSVQLVGQINNALASIVEFQPYLVVSEIARLNNVTGCVLITGQRVPPFAMSKVAKHDENPAGKNQRATARYSPCGRAPQHKNCTCGPCSPASIRFADRALSVLRFPVASTPTSRSCLSPRGSVCPPVPPCVARWRRVGRET